MKASPDNKFPASRFRSAIFCAPLLVLFFTFLSYAPNAHAGLFSVSPEKERALGAEASRDIESHLPLVTGAVEEWVNSIGNQLVAATKPEFKYSFRVISSPEINAFALPGGYIYVNSGLRKIAKTDDELAAILAHEITHAEEHHFARQYSRASKRGTILGIGAMVLGLPNLAATAISIADFAITQKYSRALETEADKDGMLRLARAGFDPAAMVTILENLEKESERGGTLDKWFASHPDPKGRIENARAELKAVKALQAKNDPLVKPVITTDSYLKQMPIDAAVNNSKVAPAIIPPSSRPSAASQ